MSGRILSWGLGLALFFAPPLHAAPTPKPSARGAEVPYVEYEAEDGVTNGAILGPTRIFGQIASEASGRECVQLSKPGQGVTITATAPANSVVVRYCIPDAPKGGGINATLSLYVNGSFVRKLALTSRYCWNYKNWTYPYDKNPADGSPFHFFDETRALLPVQIRAGDSVALVKGPADTAAFYDIDLVDLEQVAPPLPRPAGFLSVTDAPFSAKGDGVHKDGAAIQACINAAEAKGLGVWIPEGAWLCDRPFTVGKAVIRGAGMWHSTLRGLDARFMLKGKTALFSDFSVSGETVNRVDSSPESAFSGRAGPGTLISKIWVEHTKCGYWVGPGTRGLTIRGCRFRDTYADGVNFYAGTSESTVTECSARNTGDDSFASWSPRWAGVNTRNVFSHDTAQAPWRANGFAVYAGTDNAVEDDVVSDTVDYPGILIGAEFKPHAFGGTTRILRDTLLRCGGPFDGREQPALKFSAREGDMEGIVVDDLDITAPTYAGIAFSGRYRITGITLDNVTITDPGTCGIQAWPGAEGVADFRDTAVRGTILGLQNDGAFVFHKGHGNRGW